MGLKKIFSTKDKKDRESSSLKSDKSAQRESPSTLSRAFSNWSSQQKVRSRLKHTSLGSNRSISSHNLSAHDAKRLSEPVAPSPSLSHQLPLTRGNKVTQNYDQQQKTRQMKTNPFTTISAATSPITPSDSMRDVNNVVNVLRNSMSSAASLSTFASATDEEKHTQYNTSHDTLDSPTPAAKQKDGTNPFLHSHDTKPTTAVPQKRQSQVFYPLPMKFDNDSNKYELSEDEYHAMEHGNFDAPITPPESAQYKRHSQVCDESLYAELLAVQQQLDAVNPNNAVDIQKRLSGVNQLLAKARDNSGRLETRLKTVIDTSKQTIVAINEENKILKAADETTKSELEQIKQQHQETKEKHQDQLAVYQELKEQHDGIVQENQAFLEETQQLSARLDQHIATHKDISLLLNDGKSAREGDQEEETDLLGQFNKMVALTSSSQLLNKQLEVKLQDSTRQHTQEMQTLKQTFEAEKQQHLESKKQELVALETAKDQQLELKQQELSALQTKLEDEKAQELELKDHEIVSLQIKMDTDAKTLERAHQAEIHILNQEQKEKIDNLVTQLKTESDQHTATLEKNHQTEMQELQAKLEQEQQRRVQALQEEHQQEMQELKAKTENDIAALEQQHQTKMQSLEAKYTDLITDASNNIKQEQEKWQQRETELVKRIECLEESNKKSKSKLESCTAHKQELEEKSNRLQSQIEILSSKTSDHVQNVAQDNISFKQESERLQKEHQGLEEQCIMLTKTLESTKEENLGLQSTVDEIKQQLLELQSSKEASEKVLKERIHMINEQSAQFLAEAQHQNEKKALECQQLRNQLAEMEQVSREAAKSVMDENDRLENRLHQMEASSQLTVHENIALNEQVELLSKNTSRRSIAAENQQLKNELKMMNNIRQENISLSELVECLQAKVKEVSMNGRYTIAGASSSKDNNSQQEELMLMHTRAQLGLIEYLEGEDNVLLAMSKFKKQLEAEMKGFASTANSLVSTKHIR
ncbi:hypothetical protein [Parasitella parasitica]|uniref:Uncharacterized protein n=1 Tax=Parasitella parasitica TaxID=35722 RepID=A0A0B7NGZ5_9FUNG|nr:hypothetical protein [Parasitella parasitica]